MGRRPGSREQDLAADVRKLIGKFANAEGVVREVVDGHALIGLRSRDLARD